jgi:glutathione peroxidase
MRKILSAVVNLAAMWRAAPSTAPLNRVRGSAYDFEFTGIDGKPLKLSAWRGKVLLIVNTASLCGYTGQYAGLQNLWTRFANAGLVIIGVPSNDFGGQEPKPEAEIEAFCAGTFGVTFPLTAKEHVTGPNAHPFFKWAAEAAGPGGAPNWNFHKYLIGRDGRLFRSFSTKLPPESPEIVSWIEMALAEPEADKARSSAAAGNRSSREA